MALLELNHSTTRQHEAGRIGKLFSDLGAYFARRSMYRRTVRELSALSVRDLADLGLTQGMIHGVARSAALNAK